MAMTNAGMATTIKTELESISVGDFAAISGPLLDAFADAIAKAVVEYIKSNADVVGVATNVAVVSVYGVTTGPGTSGPGTGTGAQTGTGNLL